MADNYRALTRTYRPTSFEEIVSQTHVSNTLKNAIRQNRLAHAYMFCGPRGVGKTTMARVLARTVNEIDRQVDGESLNQTLNVVEIDAASNNSVDDIRDLRERVRIPPQNGRYKIYIIDEVHMLSKAAFNALLKTLEEPPGHVIFIFATTEPHKVLPTILSRVQRFDFKRISVDEIVERLGDVARDEGIAIDGESLHVIAKKADGALRDALGLMDQAIAFCGSEIQHEELLRALNVVSTDRMFDFMEAVEEHDAGRGLQLISELLQEGYDIQEYLVGLTEHLRNLYVARNARQMHLVEASPETKQRYKKASEAFSEDDLMRMLHIVSEAQYKIKEAHQPKIQFEITLLKLIHMERTQNLNSLLSELEQLKKKLNNRATASSEEELTSGKPHAEATSPSDGGPSSEPASLQETSDNGRVAEEEQRPAEDKDRAEPAGGEQAPSAEAAERKQSPSSRPAEGTDARPAGKPQETAGATAPGQDEQEEEEFSNLFGASSLGTTEPSNGSPAQTETVENSEKKRATKKAPKNVSLQEVNNKWENYLENLKQQVPQMLYFQMQRVDPIRLKKGELLLRCNDDFAKKIVEENKRQLGKILEDGIGAFLNFNCSVQKDDKATEESMSPYERFKQLQKRDPTIKKLVDLFGAELDYNLNQ